ncbi:MAG TPA: TSUP family transporter, partial [Stellaceae bacterium]|nr:TSUP family transporter [Stellaceae bacterium]
WGGGGARLAGPLVGLVAGVLGGMSAMFGPPMIAYLVGLGTDPASFVKQMAILALAASTTLLLALSGAGALSPVDLAISGAALIPIQLGMPAGRWLRGRIKPGVFRIAVLAVLAGGGLDLLRRTWF